MKKIGLIISLAVSAMFLACGDDSSSNSGDDNDNAISQQKIETKIVGKWKNVSGLGEETLTNNRFIETYEIGGEGFVSSCTVHPETKELGWINKKAVLYTVSDNSVIVKDNMEVRPEGAPKEDESRPAPEPMENKQQITSIDDSSMSVSRLDGELQLNFKKVTADYSQDIIGMWEGVEVTGYETYGNAEHRIEYKADGTYTYYDKVDGNWETSANVDNEYNVDGDWLATRWRPEAGADYNYEWWDIDSIKDGTMKWSALREKEDGERFTTTFIWKKVEN
mgnify:CR=1 FL=1